jgi:hypothetical protein
MNSRISKILPNKIIGSSIVYNLRWRTTGKMLMCKNRTS